MSAHIKSLQLIKEVKKRPVIWDHFSHENKDKFKKAEAWMQIYNAMFDDYEEKSTAEQMNIERELHSRWKSIRDSYTRDYKKFANRSKQGHQNIRFRRYIFTKQLSFLNKVMKPKCNDNVASSPQDSEDGTDDANIRIPNATITTQPESFERVKRSRSTSREEVQKFLDKRNKISIDDETIQTKEVNKSLSLEEMINKLLEGHDQPKRDEDKDFFMSMLPSVYRLNEDQKLEFRVQVLQALQNVKAGHHSSMQISWPQSNVNFHHNQNSEPDPTHRLKIETVSTVDHSILEAPQRNKKKSSDSSSGTMLASASLRSVERDSDSSGLSENDAAPGHNDLS